MIRRFAAAVTLVTLVSSSAPAFASDRSEPANREAPAPSMPPPDPLYGYLHYKEPSDGRRPAVLPGLYVSLAALNAADVCTTSRGLRRGAVETNPLVGQAADNAAAMIGLKVASMAGTIYFAERLWKKGNKVGAVVMMVAVNGAMAAVVANNARIAKKH